MLCGNVQIIYAHDQIRHHLAAPGAAQNRGAASEETESHHERTVPRRLTPAGTGGTSAAFGGRLIRQDAKRAGLEKTSMAEIDAEVKAARTQKRAKPAKVSKRSGA